MIQDHDPAKPRRLLLVAGFSTLILLVASVGVTQEILPPPIDKQPVQPTVPSTNDKRTPQAVPYGIRPAEVDKDGSPLPAATHRQSSPPGDSRSPGDASDADTDAVYNLIRQLQQQRQSLAADVAAENESTVSQGSSRSRQPRALKQLRRDLREYQQTSEQRTRRIEDKLLRLKELLESKSYCTQQAESDQGVYQPNDAVPNAASSEVHQPPETNKQAVGSSDATDSKDATLSRPDDSANVPGNELPTPGSFTNGPMGKGGETAQPNTKFTNLRDSMQQFEVVSIVDHSVDPLALANNLYGTKEWNLALNIYQEIDRSKLAPQDRLWIEYQLGNCQRQLQNLAEARRHYRIVTSSAEGTYWDKSARWWLESLDERVRSQQRLANINRFVEQISAEVTTDEQSRNPGT